MSKPQIPFLITGATSGLGFSILHTLYHSLPDTSKSSICASSSRPESAEPLQAKYPGIRFRVVNYDDEPCMTDAFEGVDKLFFVSSPEFDGVKREVQHGNVVRAARRAGVGRVYYSSLAFGGYEPRSVVGLQGAHLTTEKMLKESGIPYISVREGIYTDAFPVFIFWYPDTHTVYLTADGPVAFSSRAELGEATARLMLRDPETLSGYLRDNIALLTAEKTYTLSDVVSAVRRATGTEIRVQNVSRETYPDTLAAEDAKPGHGGKSRAFFEYWVTIVDGIAQGEATTTSPLMRELLGREPRDAMGHVEELVREGMGKGGYTWHQNYVR